jgi:glutamyl/glutaminyl-tRNA synthetase
VDDPLMEITHVIRGDDHLSNTPRQILVQEALGLEAPTYAHLPLVVGPDRVPLGKRHEGVSIREFKAAGFLPCAILNAAARHGWSPGEGGRGGRGQSWEEGSLR